MVYSDVTIEKADKDINKGALIFSNFHNFYRTILSQYALKAGFIAVFDLSNLNYSYLNFIRLY